MKDVTRTASVLYGTGSRRYTAAARTSHWITAALIFAVIPLGWMYEFKTKGTPPTAFEGPFAGDPGTYASVHKTLGLIVFALVAARIIYRLVHRPPALPGSMAAWQKGLSHASHWLLYLALLVMPISGYIMSSSGSHPISILGLFDVPKAPIDKATGKIAQEIHLVTQYVIYALLTLHVGATAWHMLVRRDAILDRMLPRQANAE